MVCFTAIPRMAIRMAAASLTGKKDGGFSMPYMGAKKSKWTKAIALSREFCAQ
jgi:hypothetical protein